MPFTEPLPDVWQAYCYIFRSCMLAVLCGLIWLHIVYVSGNCSDGKAFLESW